MVLLSRPDPNDLMRNLTKCDNLDVDDLCFMMKRILNFQLMNHDIVLIHRRCFQ